MSDAAEGSLSSGLEQRLGSLTELRPLLLQWGLNTLRKLSWTSPERIGKLLDALPVGGPSEGVLADFRAVHADMWEARQPRKSEEEVPKPLQVLEHAAGMGEVKKPSSRRLVDEEATRKDLEAREVAKGMLGESGRLLRSRMEQYFEMVSEHSFTMMLSHLPYDTLALVAEQACQEPWHPLLTRDVLNTSLLRQDWSIRSAFMGGFIPRTNLIPLYGTDGFLRKHLVAQRPLSEEESRHPKVVPLQDASPMVTMRTPSADGTVSCMPCLHGFKLLFNEFTQGVLKDIFELPTRPKQRIFAAGGAVLACAQLWQHPNLQPFYRIAAREGGYFESLRRLRIGQSPQVLQNILAFAACTEDERRTARKAAEKLWLPQGSTGSKPSWGFASSDIDLFITCETEEEGKDLLRRTVEMLCKNITDLRIAEHKASRAGKAGYPFEGLNDAGYSRDLRLLRSANALSVWGGWPFRTVQVMVILYKGMDEVLNFFDLDCISLGFDGRNVHSLPRTLRAFQTGFNFVEPAKLRRWSTGPRILKYKKRGFGTVFFEICKHHPRCDLPETLDDETARRIAALQGFVTASQDFGYGEVDLPFVARMRMGMHLDDYMSQHERKRQMLRDNIEQKSRGLWNPPDNDLVAGKYRYIAGNESASAQSIASLLAVSLEDGLPPVRWKNADLWESRRGNEFLPRCYMCRGRIDPSATCAERPRVCGSCEALNAEKLQQVADLRGKTCVVTGGRVNIGYATALRLLRNGATVAVTSRFPRDCLRRYGREEDAGQWLPRLSVYGADFRSVPSVAELGKTLAAAFPRLDVLVNNAAQTVRRPSTHFAELVKAEQQPLEQRLEARLMQQADLKSWDRLEPGLEPLAAEAASEAGRASAEDGPGEQMPVEEVKDVRAETSWTARVGDISWVETLEVQVINVTAPFVLLGALKPCLLAGKVVQTVKKHIHSSEQMTATAADLISTVEEDRPRRQTVVAANLALLSQDLRFVVNVTSQEGSFRSLGNKGPNHPHTNMAKASLNMLTCSVADEFSKEGVAVVSVDTGWISKMKPEPAAEAEPHLQSAPPLTAADGAARVLDPIISTLNGARPMTGCLLRNFEPVDW